MDAGALPREIADHSKLIRCIRTLPAGSPAVRLSFERGGRLWAATAPTSRARCQLNLSDPSLGLPRLDPAGFATAEEEIAVHLPGLLHALGQTVNVYHEYDQGALIARVLWPTLPS